MIPTCLQTGAIGVCVAELSDQLGSLRAHAALILLN